MFYTRYIREHYASEVALASHADSNLHGRQQSLARRGTEQAPLTIGRGAKDATENLVMLS